MLNKNEDVYVCNLYKFIYHFRLKDDTKLDDSDNISITWNPETRLTALIFRSVKLEDSGKYSCIAYSDVGGHALTSSVMQVRGKLI